MDLNEFCLQGDLDIAEAEKAVHDLRKWISESAALGPGRLEVSQADPTQPSLQLLFAGAQAATAANIEVEFGAHASALLERTKSDTGISTNE